MASKCKAKITSTYCKSNLFMLSDYLLGNLHVESHTLTTDQSEWLSSITTAIFSHNSMSKANITSNKNVDCSVKLHKNNTVNSHLYWIGHIVQDHSDNEKRNPLLLLQGLFFAISSKGSFTCTMTGVPWLVKQRLWYMLSWVVHIKDPLLLIWKSNPSSGGSGFPL